MWPSRLDDTQIKYFSFDDWRITPWNRRLFSWWTDWYDDNYDCTHDDLCRYEHEYETRYWNRYGPWYERSVWVGFFDVRRSSLAIRNYRDWYTSLFGWHEGWYDDNYEDSHAALCRAAEEYEGHYQDQFVWPWGVFLGLDLFGELHSGTTRPYYRGLNWGRPFVNWSNAWYENSVDGHDALCRYEEDYEWFLGHRFDDSYWLWYDYPLRWDWFGGRPTLASYNRTLAWPLDERPTRFDHVSYRRMIEERENLGFGGRCKRRINKRMRKRNGRRRRRRMKMRRERR